LRSDFYSDLMTHPDEIQLREKFSQRLQHERRNTGMTQEQLAEAIGRSIDLISRLERATVSPSFETLVLLSKFFRIDVAHLLTNDLSSLNSKSPGLEEISHLVLSFPDEELPKVARVLKALKEN